MQQANEQVATLTERGHLMQGQLFLYRTAVDLDQRNFGIANTNLKNAAASLAQAKSNDKVSSLHDAIAATNINVATSLETQRDKVLSFVRQLDALVPPAEMPLSETKEPETTETTSPEAAPDATTGATAVPSEAPPVTVQ